jgi:prepilin-type N-terminal cleavage/methylation domain-containing protein
MFLFKKLGFTLVELLVVVSVIGVLSVIVISTLSSAKTKSKTAKLVMQFQQIEKAFIFTYLDENRNTWWRESELGLGANPTLKKIIKKETGPLSGFSNYFPHEKLIDELTDSQYRYDHDEDEEADCGGGTSNWAKGVNIAVTGISLKQKKAIDRYIDGEENFKCGKITYGNYEGGSLYWRITDVENSF